jgi:TonB family protein
MRFTIGLRRRTVKGKVGENPVFLLKTGFFIGMIMGNSALKIAATVSLGIHVLFFGIVSSLFQESKILQKPAHYVKVTLLPSLAEEKLNTKIIPPVPLRVRAQEGEKPSFGYLGQSPGTPLPPKSIEQDISFEEPKPILKNKEEEKALGDPVNTANAPGSGSDRDRNNQNEGNMASSKEFASVEGSLSVSLPSLHSGESSGGVFSFRSSGDGQGSGTGPGGSGNGGPGNGGSGKGRGVFGKFFYAYGGGNGARPNYAENPKPIYPQEAREKGYEGEVVLRVEVLSNGRVGQIEVRRSSGYESLDRSALTTVKQWRFIPAKKGDIAIPLWVNIPIKFQLQ